MGKRKRAERLTVGEIQILQMLWSEGPVTLVQAQRAFGRPIGYTTVQTRLNRLVEKGVVTRSRKRPAKFEAAISPEDVSGGDLDFLIERVSGGRVTPLVAHLVRDRSLSDSEIRELKQLIADAEHRLKNESQEKKS